MRVFSLVILLLVGATCCEASRYCDTRYHAVREYQAPGHFYLIDYEYDVEQTMYPANGESEPHYPARITVYEIVQGEKHQVGRVIHGVFTHRGCTEDRPMDMVQAALGAN